MNKTAIKNYAIWARVQLIESVKQRAFEYEITDNGENPSTVETVGGRLLSKEEKEQRRQLIEQIRQKGYNQVMEEAAYTWFNRFIALRFMEINGYLPSKTRVFTDESGAFKPEMLKQAMSIEIDGLDRSKVLDLIDKQDNDELFKYLLITQCNALNTGLPYMFEKIANWTELLFPANLLRNDSVIGQMIAEVPEEDWTDAVQIIGWMYQYYNSELKDETFALLKKNVKITKERIPAATQLFTPDWIVRYMVENSLGRLWYEGHPDFDKSQWKYYLDEAEQEPEVEQQLQKIRAEYATIRPEEIKVIDPCMGSGHILVCAFDVFMQIYTSAGWSERDAAKSIIENNLYGLDIDDRAGQLAYFAVMMKARKYNRRILNGEVRPNVISIQESNWMTDEFIAYVAGKDSTMKADLIMLRKTFRDAKEYGSILNVPKMQYEALYERIDAISKNYAEDLFQAQYQKMTVERLLPLVKQSQIMSQKYDAVVTNPPYMGSSGMNASLSGFIKEKYPDSKSDLSTVAMECCINICKDVGYVSMINIPVWMFISSYEKLRRKILVSNTYVNMVHPGRGVFGSDFGTTVFVLMKKRINKYIATYRRLFDKQGDVGTIEEREKAFFSGKGTYTVDQSVFSKIPGVPVAYWAGKTIINSFAENPCLGDLAEVKIGMGTGKNELFVREWWEVSKEAIDFGISDISLLDASKGTFFPYNKGGDYRLWYGNLNEVLWFDKQGRKKMNEMSGHRENGGHDYYFKQGITWSFISASKFGVRKRPAGSLFDVAGSTLFISDELFDYVLAFLCSVVCNHILNMLNPTLNYQAGNIKSLPLIQRNTEMVKDLARKNVEMSKDDWDAFETSWDFKRHPFI